MTGYGRGAAPFGERRVTVQMKSVNHRFVDIKVRGAPLDPAVEDKVNALIRKRIQRGSVAISVRIEGGASGAGTRPDIDEARRVYRELSDLSRDLGIDAPVGLELVCAQPGVMVQRDAADEGDALAISVTEALGEALDALTEMRDAEGKALAADLSARVARVRELADQVRELVADAPADAQARLRERLKRLLKDGGVQVDEARLAQEVALIADRQDVTEEVVRIHSHVDQFEKLMKAKGAVGRRLDFLVQELGREINTVGSKSQTAEIAAVVVEAKAELEKVREQIQNVE
jgi:uncharacterized protein (TIGR00255 family)